MLCPSCHTQNRDNAKFCKGCGQLLSPETGQATFSPEAPGKIAKVAEAPAYLASEQKAEIPVAAPLSESVSDTDDSALAPTQILTPQQMIAYQARRWQHELERERASSTWSGSPGYDVGEKTEAADIADMPTTLFTASEADAPTMISQSAQEQRDIADMPTILISPVVVPKPPSTAEAHADVEDMDTIAADATATTLAVGTPVGASFSSSPTPSSSTATTDGGESTASNITAEEAPSPAEEATSPASEEEGRMEQPTPARDDNNQQPVSGDQSEQQQPAQTDAATTSNFPVLAIGALVTGRYEVTQVISDESSEHLYQVTDHQGYQHCWNCGSEENAEGDEFCITCGAELINASYIMHEYPAESNNNEAHVLQGAIVHTFVDQGHTYVIEQPQATQTAFPNGIHLLSASDSDAGDVRRSEPNEDSTLVLELQRVHESHSIPIGVFIIADGMGGHDNGQGASRMTISTISERIIRDLFSPPLQSEKAGGTPQEFDEDTLVAALHGAVEDANAALCQANQRDKSDMGSTLTGFMVVGDHAYIINVGDSRTYMLRDGNLYQLTTDHSLVAQLVAGGLIEPDDVYTHPQRSQIYRSLGDKLNVQIDIFKQQLHPGDRLLSCSDGLWEMVRNPQITDILNAAPDPQTASTQLIDAANANGGEDNVSTVIVFVR